MTTRRRGLRLCASAAVIALTLGAAVGGLDGLVASRAQADSTELQKRYLTTERMLATERAILSDVHAGDRRGGTTRSGYTRAASATSRALARAAEQAPADLKPQLTRLATTHRIATRSAQRALSGAAGSPPSQRDLRSAARLLDRVARSVETLAAANVAATPAPWPNSPRGYAGLLAVALATLVGIAAIGRRALELMRTGSPARRSSDHELARLVSEARTDSLTRLGNHRAFHDDLAAEIETRNSTGSPFSLMAIDLDGLKSINDTQGHQAGDAHIVRLAEGIKTTVGSSGTVYRTGGDEFMVVLPGIRNWHAINLAHRILGATRSRTGRTLSIGVTETQGTEHRQALARQADLALYEAKGATLGIVPFRAGMEPGAPARADGYSPDQRALAAALARTVDVRDLGTHNHSETVAELASGMGARLNLQGHHLERLRVAALLHDVGKIAVADAILRKETPLASSEQDQMRDHIAVGRDILVAAGFDEEATWVYHHHEHFDGTGYPDGLTGDAIPLESRIIAVADAFEAMTGARPYRENVSSEQALAELFACAGSQFDPTCVRALAGLVDGSLGSALLAPLRAASSTNQTSSKAERKLIA